MKKILVVLILLCAGYWGAMNQAKLKTWMEAIVGRDAPAEEESVATTGTDTQAAPSSTQPKPAPVAKTPSVSKTTTPASPGIVAPNGAETSVVPSMLPALAEGVYYTRERISQVTDAGVVGIPERTEVRVVSEDKADFIVEAGGKRATVSRTKLTNDPAEVQAMLQETKALADKADIAAAEKERLKNAPKPPEDLKKAKEANAIRANVLLAEIQTIDRHLEAARVQVNLKMKEARIAKSDGRPQAYANAAIAKLNAQIAALEAQRSQKVVERAAIPGAGTVGPGSAF